MESNQMPSLMPNQFASVGRRLLALFLDTLIVAIPCAIANHIVPVLGGLVVLFFYAPIFEASEARATLGKYLVGIQVTDISGRRISLRAALIRNILKGVSTVLLFIGFFFALFTEKKQALHDMLADTFVVYGRDERSLFDVWLRSVKDLFGSGAGPAAGSFGVSESRTLSELERLQALREKGALSEEEFQAQKKKILES